MIPFVATNRDAANVATLLLEPLGDAAVGQPLLDLLIDRLYEGRAAGVAAREDWRKIRHYGSQPYEPG